MHRKHTATAAVLAAGVLLASCSDYTTVEGTDTPATTSPATSTPLDGALQTRKLWERDYTTRQGVTVTCLSMSDSALSCDWEGARRNV